MGTLKRGPKELKPPPKSPFKEAPPPPNVLISDEDIDRAAFGKKKGKSRRNPDYKHWLDDPAKFIRAWGMSIPSEYVEDNKKGNK